MHMETVEETDMDTSTLEMKPKDLKKAEKCWRNSREINTFIDHLNSIDPTGSIEFMDEPETDGSIVSEKADSKDIEHVDSALKKCR